MLNVTRIELTCNAHKGEVESIIKHDPVTEVIDERRTEKGTVTIKARRFTVYSRTPVSLARDMYREVCAAFPSALVTLRGC